MITMLSSSHGNVQGQNLRVAFVDHTSGAASVSERFTSFNATLANAGIQAGLVLVPTSILGSTKVHSQVL
jgi:pyruvoyl-dependent arginine decarboxylase (PvlArgDC)